MAALASATCPTLSCAHATRTPAVTATTLAPIIKLEEPILRMEAQPCSLRRSLPAPFLILEPCVAVRRKTLPQASTRTAPIHHSFEILLGCQNCRRPRTSCSLASFFQGASARETPEMIDWPAETAASPTQLCAVLPRMLTLSKHHGIAPGCYVNIDLARSRLRSDKTLFSWINFPLSRFCSRIAATLIPTCTLAQNRN
jgi:hypothetical protein